jgi:ABC-type multidrug transport system fused ATPase/permease subunit
LGYFLQTINVLRDRIKIILNSYRIFLGEYSLNTVFIISSNILLSLLDLIAIGMVGLLTTLAINGIQSKSPQGIAYQVINIIGLENSNFRSQCAIVGSLAAFLMILRTVSSAILQRLVMRFLINNSTNISDRLVNYTLKQDYLELQKKSIQQNVFMISDSVRNVSIGIVGTSLSLFSDMILTVVLFIGLAYFDLLSTFVLCFMFISVLLPIHLLMQKRVRKLGEEFQTETLKLRSKIVEAINNYREMYVHNRIDFYINRIKQHQISVAKNAADAGFVPYVSKYVLEVLIVLTAISLAGYQFTNSTASHAITILSIFLTASSRLTPAILRIQQAFVILRLNLSSSKATIDLLRRLGNADTISIKNQVIKKNSFREFTPEIKFEDVSFNYPSNEKLILDRVNLHVNLGTIFGIAGESGEGKSTLVDLLLGILEPTKGQIFISGLTPKNAINFHAGRISYVPQNIHLINGTLRENLTLGFLDTDFSDEHLYDILEKSALSKFVSNLPNGLDSYIQDLGTNLSGGQKQRIGIARALLTNPQLLVFDESTSALDVSTENEILESLLSMKDKLTIILIAHRITTLRICDQILFLEKGKVMIGKFEQLNKNCESFSKMVNQTTF